MDNSKNDEEPHVFPTFPVDNSTTGWPKERPPKSNNTDDGMIAFGNPGDIKDIDDDNSRQKKKDF
eukprot:7269085-Ditylum_brightwellii.AAC.1